MQTIHNLVFKLKEGKKIKGVYPNEEYILFINNLKSTTNKVKEIETEIPFNEDVDLKVLSVENNRVLVKDKNNNKEWFTFLEDDDSTILYLSELKNNKVEVKDENENFDITLDNEVILENFDFVCSCI